MRYIVTWITDAPHNYDAIEAALKDTRDDSAIITYIKERYDLFGSSTPVDHGIWVPTDPRKRSEIEYAAYLLTWLTEILRGRVSGYGAIIRAD